MREILLLCLAVAGIHFGSAAPRPPASEVAAASDQFPNNGGGAGGHLNADGDWTPDVDMGSLDLDPTAVNHRTIEVYNWGLASLMTCQFGWDPSSFGGTLGTIGMGPYPVDIHIIDGIVDAGHSAFLDASGTRSRVSVQAIPTVPEQLGAAYSNDHATFVASMAAGRGFGLADTADIFSWACMYKEDGVDTSYLMSCLEYVIDQVAAGSNRAVINLSAGGALSTDQINATVTRAVNGGIVMVVSSGNDGDDNCGGYIQATPWSTPVGALSASGDVASFSNTGPCVTLYAPGEMVSGAVAGTVNERKGGDGTSFSAPMVAGAAALYLSYLPGLYVWQVMALLRSAGVLTEGAGTDGVASGATSVCFREDPISQYLAIPWG